MSIRLCGETKFSKRFAFLHLVFRFAHANTRNQIKCAHYFFWSLRFSVQRRKTYVDEITKGHVYIVFIWESLSHRLTDSIVSLPQITFVFFFLFGVAEELLFAFAEEAIVCECAFICLYTLCHRPWSCGYFQKPKSYC